jgi:hypothetical protein
LLIQCFDILICCLKFDVFFSEKSLILIFGLWDLLDFCFEIFDLSIKIINVYLIIFLFPLQISYSFFQLTLLLVCFTKFTCQQSGIELHLQLRNWSHFLHSLFFYFLSQILHLVIEFWTFIVLSVPWAWKFADFFDHLFIINNDLRLLDSFCLRKGLFFRDKFVRISLICFFDIVFGLVLSEVVYNGGFLKFLVWLWIFGTERNVIINILFRYARLFFWKQFYFGAEMQSWIRE